MSGPRVIHSDDLPWETGGHGDLFAHRRRRLGGAAGGQALGCTMMELDPGRTAWPFHYHHANEEALFVLQGEATLRLGDQRLPVRAGDYVALPVGPAHAHQLTNTGSTVVRYLMLSTMVVPDVCVYPDSKKVGISGALTDEEGRRRTVTYPLAAEVGYWEGEPTLGGASGSASPPSEEPASARRATLEAMVEADLEALRRKVASQGEGARDPSQADLDELKRRLDET